jgi:murein DD-endopeptidase MepM/ murein hydrolase activator NlpD
MWKIERWPLDEIYITSPFGPRKNPVTGAQQNHSGVDFRAAIGTKTFAVVDSVVTAVGDDDVSGRYVVLTDAAGHRYSYAHLEAPLVSKGATVRAGDAIGLTGNTGRSTGPHLHWGVRPQIGVPFIDPMTLIVGGGGGLLPLLAAFLVLRGLA